MGDTARNATHNFCQSRENKRAVKYIQKLQTIFTAFLNSKSFILLPALDCRKKNEVNVALPVMTQCHLAVLPLSFWHWLLMCTRAKDIFKHYAMAKNSFALCLEQKKTVLLIITALYSTSWPKHLVWECVIFFRRSLGNFRHHACCPE